MAEIKYDIRRGADIYRVIYGSRLRSWISTGYIKRGEVVVWRSGLSGWRKPEELEELAPFFERYKEEELRKKRPKKQILLKKRKKKKKIRNILIIDDEKYLCELLYDLLTQRRYNVVIANTKREAGACLKKKRPDLVFLDLKLPDGDGITLLPKIKKINPNTMVNVISAYGDEEKREEARNKGAYTFIDKPFTEKDILKSIKAVS